MRQGKQLARECFNHYETENEGSTARDYLARERSKLLSSLHIVLGADIHQTFFRMSRCMPCIRRDCIVLIFFRLSQVSYTGCCRSRTYTTLSLCRRSNKR